MAFNCGSVLHDVAPSHSALQSPHGAPPVASKSHLLPWCCSDILIHVSYMDPCGSPPLMLKCEFTHPEYIRQDQITHQSILLQYTCSSVPTPTSIRLIAPFSDFHQVYPTVISTCTMSEESIPYYCPCAPHPLTFPPGPAASLLLPSSSGQS